MQQKCCTHKSLSKTPSKPIFGQVEVSTLTALIVRNFLAKNEANRSATSRNMTSRGNKICGGDTKTPASSTHGTRSKSSTANSYNKELFQNCSKKTTREFQNQVQNQTRFMHPDTASQLMVSPLNPSAHQLFVRF